MAVSGGMGGAVAKGVIGGAIGEGMQQAGSSYADAIEKNNGNTRSKTNGVSKMNAFQNHIPSISHKPWVKYHDLKFNILSKFQELLLKKIKKYNKNKVP